MFRLAVIPVLSGGVGIALDPVLGHALALAHGLLYRSGSGVSFVIVGRLVGRNLGLDLFSGTRQAPSPGAWCGSVAWYNLVRKRLGELTRSDAKWTSDGSSFLPDSLPSFIRFRRLSKTNNGAAALTKQGGQFRPYA